MQGMINGRTVAVTLLALSIGVNVLQANKIHNLVSPSGDKGSLVGTLAMPIEAHDVDGRAVRLTVGAGLPTVLYYFSPSCTWCERNWTNLEALTAGANGRYRVVAVTAARDVKAFVEERHLKVEVLEALPDEALRAYRFSGTPHTVVIDQAGLVTHEWRGAYLDRIAGQIEDLFDLVLPGLSEPGPTSQPR